LRTTVSGGTTRLKLDQQEFSAKATSLSASIDQAKVNRREIFARMIPNFHDYLSRAGSSYNHCLVDVVLSTVCQAMTH